MTDELSRNDSNIVEAVSAEQLGRRIRELRTQQGLTLDELAERSGVSRAMLSKMERGENNPTLVVAVKVAVALGLTTAQLIGVEERKQAIKVPKNRHISFVDPDTGLERQLFPAFEGRPLEFVRLVIPEGASSEELPAHPMGHVKYIIMEQGSLRVVVGTQEYILEAGDLFFFAADLSHRFDNVGSGSCSYYLIKHIERG
jgi:transcriptional regulator with XRE-family HTH domain